MPRGEGPGTPERGEVWDLEREAEDLVADWIDRAKITVDGPGDRRGFLPHSCAGTNSLPKNGREYLAAELQDFDSGADPRPLLPPGRKRKNYMPADVLAAVEHEKMKRGQARADRFIYDSGRPSVWDQGFDSRQGGIDQPFRHPEGGRAYAAGPGEETEHSF